MDFNFELGVDDQQAFVERSRQFNVGDLLRKAARMHADSVAVAEPGTEWTYDELNERVNGLANALLDRGHDPEDATVAVLSENRSEIVEIMYAGAKTGHLVPVLNWRLERDELVHCVDLVEPDVMIASEEYREKLAWVEEDAKVEPAFVHLDEGADGGTEYESLLADGSPEEPLPDRRIHPEQGLLVLYTSGTTGLPKGVVISHRTWLARAAKNTIDFEVQKGDDELIWPPMFHMISADWVPTMAISGGTYYPIDGFDTERIVEILQSDGPPIGWMMLLPGVVERFLDYIDEHDLDVTEFREMRNIGALVDLVDPKKVQRITELFDMPYANTYGATECDNVLSGGGDIPVGVRPDEDDLAKVESSFTDLKLIDEDWNEVEGYGELAVRGPSIASGYVKNPEANQADFRDGWFRTGDIFRKNDDGTYSFVNRRKYLIKSGGENIYPAEIEQILLEDGAIEDAIVVRTPDEKWGEVPRAIVSTHDPDAVDAEDLLETLRDRIAGYKLPHYVDVVDPGEFPRSATGKIVRDQVEEWDVDDDSRIREV